MILVFHHCGLSIISNMEFLFFLGNQLVYLYRPTRKYTYQIIFTRCSNHPEILIPLYLPKHIICPQLVIVSPKVIIHSQKCSFTHIRCHLFYSFSSNLQSGHPPNSAHKIAPNPQDLMKIGPFFFFFPPSF